MADAARSAPAAALSRRVSPVATALLILLACPCAAVNLYGHPSSTLRVVTLGVGIAALVTAFASYRMFLLVDDEGVALRYLSREQWLPWSEIDRAEIVHRVRGSETIRFVRRDGSYADVPPSLLQPVKPTGRPVARRMLQETLRQVEARRPADR
jgi:Bacterial PH domain